MSEAYSSDINYAAIFNIYTTMGYKYANEGNTLAEIMQTLQNNKQFNTTDEYKILCDAVANDAKLGGFIIKGQSWQDIKYDSGTSACIFEEPGGAMYVSYSGTQDGEWMDNGKGMYMESTPQQERAAVYFDDMVKKYGWTQDNQIMVTGHSKGGNKSQYVTLAAENRHLIDQCYSMDGQGFSPEAIAKFKALHGEEEYNNIVNNMYSISGENDYINPLGITIIPKNNRSYLETPVEKYDFAGYHQLKNFFLKDREYTGKLNAQTERGDLSYMAEDLSKALMSMPIEERKASSMAIMQIVELAPGGRYLVGLDGTALTEEQLKLFLKKDVAVIISTLIQSEAGKRLLFNYAADKLEELIKEKPIEGVTLLLGLSMAVITIGPLAVPLLYIIKNGIGFLNASGFDNKDVIKFLSKFVDTAIEGFQRIGDLFHGRGLHADYGSFSVKCSRMIGTANCLNNCIGELGQISEEIREIKNQIDIGLLTRCAFSIKLAGCARNVEDRAESIKSMKKMLEEGEHKYLQNEKIISNAY